MDRVSQPELSPHSQMVFVPADPPRSGRFAIWGDGVSDPEGSLDLVLPTARSVRRRRISARFVSVTDALPLLLDADRDSVTPSQAAWSVATTAAVGLIGRGRLLPAVTESGMDAWRIGPLDAADAEWLRSLAAAFPPLAHPLEVTGIRPLRIRSAESVIREAWDAIADTMVRSASAPVATGTRLFAAPAPTPVPDGLRTWLHGTQDELDAGARACLRLELPDSADEPARAVLQLRSSVDPSLMIDTADLWRAPAAVLARFGTQAETDLLLALRRGARAWPPLGPLLHETTPTALLLDDDVVAGLMDWGAEALAGAGIELLWPADLFEAIKLHAVATPSPQPVTDAGFTLDTLLQFRWQLTIGGEVLSQEEVDALAEAKRPMVRIRGRWVAVDAALVAKLRQRKERALSGAEALAAALTGGIDVDGERVEFLASGPLADLAARLTSLTAAPPAALKPPNGLVATLRPYQLRGVSWLAQMCASGLGGCLADDMGLGKTVQVIALHLHRRTEGHGRTLVVCPTSLLGNWERELHRFAPDVPVRRYHGGGRHLDDLADDEVVLVTYGVVLRDREELATVDWSLVVADEAQAVKNPLSRTARELRGVPAAARVALTGTPVENRLTDLWAILDWTTPGLLGPLERFRTTIATPVERYRDPDRTRQFSRLVRPFLLRRRKSDPGIAPELPPKTETDRLVSLSTEQATLYEAVVRETMDRISRSEGIERQGLVFKLLVALKQICNHPAQYLHQPGPLTARSGKLAALDDLLEIITAEGESVLVFSQFVQMAALLEAHFAGHGLRTLFLHGGVPARARERMVDEFQSGAAPVFILSLKAGGVGLNLTRATHVVHYDRWWNPAVEDQATDRAHRIGQHRPVQVHRLVAEGTVEDRIAELLERKRGLAEAVVGGGEAWIAELADNELRELVSLGTSR
ncbi:MAG: DEAD/DEAH box helicase [Nocardioidaceae bacterium]